MPRFISRAQSTGWFDHLYGPSRGTDLAGWGSAQYPDLLSLDQLKIDPGAEAGLGGCVHEAVAVDGDVLGEPVFLHRVRQQYFEELGVPGRHDDVQIGDVVQRVAAVVHFHVHTEGFGKMGRLDQGGDPTLDCNVAAQKVGRALHDPRRIGIEARDRELGREDWDIELLLELDVVVDVLLGERSSYQ